MLLEYLLLSLFFVIICLINNLVKVLLEKKISKYKFFKIPHPQQAYSLRTWKSAIKYDLIIS